MPRRKQSQGSENSTGAEKHETPSKRKLNQPGSSLSSISSIDESSNNKILCTTLLSKYEGGPSYSCKVKEQDSDHLPLLSAKETNSKDVCFNSRESKHKPEDESAKKAAVENRDTSVSTVNHKEPLTVNHKHNPNPVCRDVLRNSERTNTNHTKMWNQGESGSTEGNLPQEMVNVQDDVASVVSKRYGTQDSNISFCNISEEDRCSGSNSNSMKTSNKDRRDSAYSNFLLHQTESYLMNTESSIPVTSVMLNTLSYNQCVRSTEKEIDDKKKEYELKTKTLEQKTAYDVTLPHSSNQEIPTNVISSEGMSTSLYSSTELKVINLTGALPSNTMAQVTISQGSTESSVSLPFMVYCPTIKAANVKSGSHIITDNNLMPNSVSGSTVNVCNMESGLQSLTSSGCNYFTESSSSKGEMGKSKNLSMYFQLGEENTDIATENQKTNIITNSIYDPLVSFEKESTSPLNQRLRLKIPETKAEEFSTLLDGSVTISNHGASLSAKSVKSPVVTSPQILEERISKLISENAAIVETLDPLWSWRYTRQSSISSSQNVESELKKCKSGVRMRRYSEDSSLAKKVNSNVTQYLGSKFQFALMGKGISESCEDINKIFVSSQEVLPLHDSDEKLSVLEKVDIHEEAFQQHSKSPQRSIIKDLLLKDRNKEKTVMLDLDKPLVIETTKKSPQISFLCRLCNIVFHSRENFIAHQQHYCKRSQEYTCTDEENLHFLKGNISSSGSLITSSPLIASVPQLSKSNSSAYSLVQQGKMLPPDSGILLQTYYHGISNSSHPIKKSLAHVGSETPPFKKRKVTDPAVPLVEDIMSSSELPNLPKNNQYSKPVFTTSSAKIFNKMVAKGSKQDPQEFEKSQHFHPTHVNSAFSTTQESSKVKITEARIKYEPLPLDNPLNTSVVVTLSKPVLNSGGTVLAVQSILKEKINSEVCFQAEPLSTSVIFETGMSSAVNSSKKSSHEELFGKTFPGTSPINLDKAENVELVQRLLGNKLLNAEFSYRTRVSLPSIQSTVHQPSVAEGLVSDQRETTVCSLIPNYNVLHRKSDTIIPGDFSEEAHSTCSDQYQYKSLVKTQSVPENTLHSPCSPFFPSSVVHLALARSCQNDSTQSPHQQPLNSTVNVNLNSTSSLNIPTSDKPLPLPTSTQRIANDSGQMKKTKPTRPSSLPLKKKVITMIGSTLISPETPRSKKHCVQQYINGHAYTYLGLKCSTRSTYCSIYRPQPMYVPQDTDPKLSMYSNWQVVPAKNIMLGLSPSQMIGLYDSRQKLHCCSGIIAVAEESSQLLITHSSYWVYRCQEQEKASKPKNLSSNPSENKPLMNRIEDEQCMSNCVEMVRPEESKVHKLSDSLEPVVCSNIDGNDMHHSPFSTSSAQEFSSVKIKHIVTVPHHNEQLISPKPVELVIPDKSKQFIRNLDQDHTLSKPLVSATSGSQLLHSHFQDQQLQLTKSRLSMVSPEKSKRFINILDQDSSLFKPLEPMVCSGRKNQLLYSQLQDQHLPKSRQFVMSPGGSKQSLLIQNQAQQWCTANSPELLIHQEEQLQHRLACKSLDSLVSPSLKSQCNSEKLDFTRSQQHLVTSAEGQKFIMPPNQELQWDIFQSVEHLNSPGRGNPSLYSHDQKQQQNSSIHTASVTSPERSEQLESKYSCVVYKQKSDCQEENQTTTSLEPISVGVVPQTQHFLTTTCATNIITLSSPNSSLIQPSAFKNVLNNSLSPARVGGRESDETSDSFQNIKLVEPTTDEESTQSEPLNDNESIPLPKRVRIFEGGFKSNEDYTYVRGRGRGKYVCEECGIRCKKPSMLKKHIRTHTDLRPFSCSHCSFAFKTKGNLTKHMKSKAHHKKCVELGIIPVPTTIDDSQIDGEALAKQEQLDQKRRQFTNGEELDDDEDEDFDEDAGDSYGEEDTDMEVLSDQRPLNDQGSQQSNVTTSIEKSMDSEDPKHEAACCLLNLSSMPTLTTETYSEKEKPKDVLTIPLQESLHIQLTEPSVDEDHASQYLTVQDDAVPADSLLLRPPLSHRSRSSSVHIPLSPGKKVTAMALAENQTASRDISLPRESVASRRYSFSVIRDLKQNKDLSQNEDLSHSSNSEQIISKSEDQDHCLVFPAMSLSVPSNSEDETSMSGIDQPMDLSVTRDMKVDPNVSADSHPEELVEPIDSLLGACLQYGSLTALKTGGLPLMLNTSGLKRRSQSPWELQQQTGSRQSVDDSVLHLSPVTSPSPDHIPSKSILHDDQCSISSRPQAEFIVAKSGCGQNLDDGKCVCDICNKTFTKPSQLRLHLNIHYFERPFRCDSCVVSFRTKGHLQKHKRSVSHYNKVNMNQTFGTPTADNPRPFKCSDCKIAFRIHGHLAKHLRSKMHIMKLECLGRLPFGMYAEMERSGTNLNEIDTTDCDSSLESLQLIAQRLYRQEPRQVVWQGDNVIGGAESPDHSLSSPESIALSLSQNKLAATKTVNFQVKQELDNVIENPGHSHQDNSNSLSVDIDKEVNHCSGQNVKPQPLSCPLCGQSFVSAKALRVHTYSHNTQWSTDEATNFTEIELALPDPCGETPQTLQKFASVQDNVKKHFNL